MRRALFVVLAACWRSSPPPPTPPPAPQPTYESRPSPPPKTPIDLMFEAFEQFTDRMCACADMTCAQQVAADMTTWSQEQAKSQAEPPKMTEEDSKRAAAIGERMGHCMQKAMSSGSGSSGSGTP